MRTELEIYGTNQPYTLVVEPGAQEFRINPGDQCRLVAVHDTEPAAFGLDHRPEYLVVWINRGGATFEFWRGNERET
ncbi:MAG TPA: hypothetical protein VGE74_00450 [Gemmata sp.]